MGEATNEQVNLMLRLYEDRREPRLREAREWFAANFHAKNEEDLMRICPPEAGKTHTCAWCSVIGKWWRAS